MIYDRTSRARERQDINMLSAIFPGNMWWRKMVRDSPVRPITMDGMAASISKNRFRKAFGPLPANSAMYIPAATPTGTLTVIEPVIRISVPANAGKSPSKTRLWNRRASVGGVCPKIRSGPRGPRPFMKRNPRRTNKAVEIMIPDAHEKGARMYSRSLRINFSFVMK